MSVYDFINLVYLMTPLIFIYSVKRNSVKIALLEILVVFSSAFVFETFNIVNGHYSYPNSYIYFGAVPLSIIFGWYILFMIGKFWTNLILSFNKNVQNDVTIVPISILLIAFASATLGLLIDPIATRLKWWEWYEPAPYLNVPIGELYGIFIAISIIGGIYWLVTWILSNISEFQVKYIFEEQEKMDLLMIALYEFICLVLVIWSIENAIDNNDVLMGAITTYLATQIVVMVVLIQVLVKEDVRNGFHELKKHHVLYFRLFLGICFLFSFIMLLSSILVLIKFQFLFPLIQSMHMILFQFSIVGFCISTTLLLIYRKVSVFEE